eukprot:TRINITY_DN11238_c0_g2_i2.p1 TRINITY_DN11238_c0_g2~~TRINITY_DN11238_c0_g2_i2.p1  ORF type:complete len:403 (+),score=52.17 TRINITY_DN11238_c0_g2_i2:134-1342(+)
MSHSCPLCDSAFDSTEECNNHLRVCDVNNRLEKQDQMLDIRDWELDKDLTLILKGISQSDDNLNQNNVISDMLGLLQRGQYAKINGKGIRKDAVRSFIKTVDSVMGSTSDLIISNHWLSHRLALSAKYNLTHAKDAQDASAAAASPAIKIWRLPLTDAPSSTTRIRQPPQRLLRFIKCTITAFPGYEGRVVFIDLPNEKWMCTNFNEPMHINKVVPHTEPLELSRPSVLNIEVGTNIKWLPIRTVFGTSVGPSLSVPIDDLPTAVRVGCGIAVEISVYRTKKQVLEGFMTSLSRKRRLPSCSAGYPRSHTDPDYIGHFGKSVPVTEIGSTSSKVGSRVKLLTEPIPSVPPPDPRASIARYLWYDHEAAENEISNNVTLRLLSSHPTDPAAHLKELLHSFDTK